jgi:hypothetical protein
MKRLSFFLPIFFMIVTAAPASAWLNQPPPDHPQHNEVKETSLALLAFTRSLIDQFYEAEQSQSNLELPSPDELFNVAGRFSELAESVVSQTLQLEDPVLEFAQQEAGLLEITLPATDDAALRIMATSVDQLAKAIQMLAELGFGPDSAADVEPRVQTAIVFWELSRTLRVASLMGLILHAGL